MKKILLVIVTFISSYNYAQQEIKIDLADALLLKTIEISYESYISDQTSFGSSILYNFEKKSSDFRYNEQFMLTPYLRHYFNTDRTWKLFGEAFFALSNGHKEIEQNGTRNIYNEYTDGALGIAFGLKYITSGGLTIDGHIGLGRNLFSANAPILVPRVGINIGWRI